MMATMTMNSNPNEPPEGSLNHQSKQEQQQQQKQQQQHWWNSSNSSSSSSKMMMVYKYPMEYILLLKRNPRYRIYLLSHICQHIGDWYVRIASLIALDRLAPSSATAISVLVLIKMGPHALLPAVGGALADSLDRRHLLMALDALGAIVTLGFVVAVQLQSLSLFYTIAALRATVYALYEPATKALVPMLVTDSMDLKRAMTLNGLAWSSLVMVGGIVAGQTAAHLGVQACFIFDSITYLLSAIVLCFLRGNYKVQHHDDRVEDRDRVEDPTTTTTDKSTQNRQYMCTSKGHLLRILRPIGIFCQMSKAGLTYLYHSGFGIVVLLKSSGSIIWGAADILNVEYAHVPNDEDATSKRLGLLFSCIGVGCLLGPICANCFTNPDRPATLQVVCIGAMAIMMSGWIGFSRAPSFGVICVFTSVRSFGSSIIWVNSSLLLQRLTVMEMMGRVLALEFAFMMFFDALAATTAARLLDVGGVAKTDVAVGAAVLAATLFATWTVYHMFGNGAANKRFHSNGHQSNSRRTNTDSGTGTTERVAQVVFA